MTVSERSVAADSIKQYQLAKKINDYSTRSVHWDKYNLNVEKNSKRNELEHGLTHFRADDTFFSEGLDDSIHAYKNNRFTANIINKIMTYCGEEWVSTKISNKQVGYPDHLLRLGGFVLDYNELVILPWLKDLSRHINHGSSVCEIGGGYSCFGRMLIEEFSGKYVNIELPESLLLANYYLRMHFPELRFYPLERLVLDKVVTHQDWLDYDIFLLPSGVTFERDIEFDLAINSRSMMEMRIDTVRDYFKLIHSHVAVGGHFLNINRIEKLTDGYPVLFCEYPYDDKWNVVYGKDSVTQKGIYSLLATRIPDENSGNIRQHLNDVRNSYNHTYWLPNIYGPAIKKVLFYIQKARRKILYITAISMAKKSKKILEKF